MPQIGGNLDPARGRSLILMFSTLSAIGAVTRDVIRGAPPTPDIAYGKPKFDPKTGMMGPVGPVGPGDAPAYAVKAPRHLRSLAGVFIVGTLALVLNEIEPQLGVAMAGILLLDVSLGLLAPQRTSAGTQPAVFDRVGRGLFAAGATAPPASAKGTVRA